MLIHFCIKKNLSEELWKIDSIVKSTKTKFYPWFTSEKANMHRRGKHRSCSTYSTGVFLSQIKVIIIHFRGEYSSKCFHFLMHCRLVWISVFLLFRFSPLVVHVFPSVLFCSPYLFSLNRFITFEHRYTNIAFNLPLIFFFHFENHYNQVYKDNL